MKLIQYECFKLFCKRSTLVILLVFSVINLIKIHSEYKSYSYLSDGTDSRSWNSTYWELYKEYSGEITEEKIESLLAVYEPLVNATADMTANTALNNPDTLTGNQYSDRNLLTKYYVNPMRYFYGYQAFAKEIARKAMENVNLYQSLGNTYEVRKNSVIYNLYTNRSITTFSYGEMYNYYLNYDFSTMLIFLICLYGLVGTFVSEKETQMDILLLTNRNGGRKTTAAKLIAVTLFVTGISLWFSVLDFAGFCASFHSMAGGNLPVYAISNFSAASVNISLFQYAILSAIIRAIGFWSIGMLLLLVSMFWRNALIPFVLDFAICLILIISGASSAYTSNLLLKSLNPYSLLTNRILFGKTELLNVFGYPVLSYAAAIAFSVAAGIFVAAAIFFLSAKNFHCRTGGKL